MALFVDSVSTRQPVPIEIERPQLPALISRTKAAYRIWPRFLGSKIRHSLDVALGLGNMHLESAGFESFLPARSYDGGLLRSPPDWIDCRHRWRITIYDRATVYHARARAVAQSVLGRQHPVLVLQLWHMWALVLVGTAPGKKSRRKRWGLARMVGSYIGPTFIWQRIARLLLGVIVTQIVLHRSERTPSKVPSIPRWGTGGDCVASAL